MSYHIKRRRRLLNWALRAVCCALFSTSVGTMSHAHEGHAPLPSKGALVDSEKGTIVLSAEAQRALRVETAEVGARKLERRTLAYAVLVTPWRRHAYAASTTSGKISAVHVKPGEAVLAGHPLAEIESLELEAVQLELLNAQAELELSTKTLAQLQNLASEQISAARELSETRARHEQNQGAKAVATSKLRSLGVADRQIRALLENPRQPLIKTVAVTSPVAGTIIHADLNVGKVVTANEHLFEIVDVTKLWVKIGVLERDLNRVAVGQRVELSLAAYPGEMIPCKVTVKGLLLDPQTHLGTIWSEIDNVSGAEPRFLPGMYGQAQIIADGDKNRLTVPADALVYDGLEHYVLVEEAATAKAFEYRKQNVVVEGDGAGYAALRDGSVFPGDRVVTKGSHELSAFFVPGVLRIGPEAAANMGLEVETIRPRIVERILEFDGAIDVPPAGRASVSSQLEGRLTRILVERGETVEPGQIVAELTSSVLQDLQLDLIQAAAQTRVNQESLDRLLTLDTTQSVARRRVWEAQSAAATARGRLDAVTRKLLTVGLTVEQIDRVATGGAIIEALPIRSSIRGNVVHFDKVLGQVIKAEEPLFEIHDLAHVWVKGFVTERNVTHLRLDGLAARARVRFVVDPDRVVTGVVRRSGGVFGIDDRTLAIWVELDARPDLVLQHNMLARVTLVLGEAEPVLAVPRSALTYEGTRAFVFVRKPDGVFERRLVDPGREDDRYVEIVAGLAVDEPIAVRGTSQLQTAYASLR